MTNTKSLPEIVSEVYSLLEPLESPDRQKVVGSALTLLGEEPTTPSKRQLGEEGSGSDEIPFGKKATRWLKQNNIPIADIEEIFHCEGNDVEVIASDIPGTGKRAQTHNCYLLSGVRSLLSGDEAKFIDNEAVSLCKTMGCHDSANHAKYRSELGNIVAGSKSSGYTLPAPGLRAAAALVKEISSSK